MYNLLTICISLILFASFRKIGSFVLKILGIKLHSFLENFVVAFCFGYFIISYILFFLGLAGFLNEWVVYTLFIILVILGLTYLEYLLNWSGIFERSYETIRSFFNNHFIGFDIYVISFSAILVFGLSLLSSFAYPTESDSMTYHLSLPKLYIDNNRIIPTTWYKDWMSPFSIEMINMFLLIIGRPHSPVFFNCCTQLFLSASIYILCARRFNQISGIFCVLFFYLSPDLILLNNSAKPDGIMFGLIFLSIHYFLIWVEKENIKYFYLSSIFTGFVLASKYQGIYWAVTIILLNVIVILFNHKKDNNFRIYYLFYFPLLAVFVSCPWYLKNYIITNDPLWPFGYALFNSEFWSAELHVKYKNWELGPGKDFKNYLFGIWNVTVRQNEWKWGLLIPYLPYNLALVPGLIFYSQKLNFLQKKAIKYLIIIAFIFYTIWFMGYQQKRYLLPLMGILNIFSSLVIVEMYKHKISRYCLRFLLYSTLFFSIIYSVVFNAQFLGNALGLESKDKFLDKKVSYYQEIKFINDQTPKDAIILVNDLKGFYFNRRWVYIPLYMQSNFINNSKKAIQFLKKEKVNYIFDPYRERFENIWNDLIASGHIEIIYENLSAKVIKSRSLSDIDYQRVVIYQVNL